MNKPTVAQVSTYVSEVAGSADLILTTIETLDPAIAPEAALVEEIAKLAAKGLAAWSASSGTPITAESVLALLPNPTPLSPPTA
jgi:hypothetical protein